MMKKFSAALLLYLGLASAALAQAQGPTLVPTTTNAISIVGTVAGSTRIITGAAGKQIYVNSLLLVPTATAVVTFTYGTGTNCGTGTTSITGPMAFSAGQTVNYGVGNGAVFVLPPGTDLCIAIATAIAPGSLAYSLF